MTIEVGQMFKNGGIKYKVIDFDGIRYTLQDEITGSKIILVEGEFETDRFIPVTHTAKTAPQKVLSVNDDGDDVWVYE